jgi:phenylalanyl-tRNA synthetase alpha chain
MIDLSKIKNALHLDELEKIRVELLGKNGVITNEFKRMKEIPNEQKREFAKNLNEMKEKAAALIAQKKAELEEKALELKLKSEKLDVSMFSNRSQIGALHPVNMTMDKIIDFFTKMNFSVETGPLIEDEFHNFEALNLPKYHPARDMQDTFYMSDGSLLRTHTSPVQIRTMMNQVCSHTGWLEVLGCGIVDPNVFKAVGYENVSGYAFGLGVERFAMLIHRINDLRSMYEGDLRLMEQFK